MGLGTKAEEPPGLPGTLAGGSLSIGHHAPPLPLANGDAAWLNQQRWDRKSWYIQVSGANSRMDSEGYLDKDMPPGLGRGGTPVVVKGVFLMEVWPAGLFPGRWMGDTANIALLTCHSNLWP